MPQIGKEQQHEKVHVLLCYAASQHGCPPLRPLHPHFSTPLQVLSPEPSSRVLDMCAAPGGKTTLLAELMQDRGEVWALDRTHAKVCLCGSGV